MPSSAPTPPERYPPSLHDALPISAERDRRRGEREARLHARPGAVCTPGQRRSQHQRNRCQRRHQRHQGRHDASRETQWRHGDIRRRSEEHTSELQSLAYLVCRLLLRRLPSATLLPYTTLFRSLPSVTVGAENVKRDFTPDLVQFAHLANGVLSISGTDANDVTSVTKVGTTLRVKRNGVTETFDADRKSTRLNSSH